MDNKLIKQIQRLCEKQYRKGFQQGYHACKNNELTLDQVNKFRYDGMSENYSKVVRPHDKKKEDPKARLRMEMGMPKMEELFRLFE